jgi:hypothetical protein
MRAGPRTSSVRDIDQQHRRSLPGPSDAAASIAPLDAERAARPSAAESVPVARRPGRQRNRRPRSGAVSEAHAERHARSPRPDDARRRVTASERRRQYGTEVEHGRCTRCRLWSTPAVTPHAGAPSRPAAPELQAPLTHERSPGGSSRSRLTHASGSSKPRSRWPRIAHGSPPRLLYRGSGMTRAPLDPDPRHVDEDAPLPPRDDTWLGCAVRPADPRRGDRRRHRRRRRRDVPDRGPAIGPDHGARRPVRALVRSADRGAVVSAPAFPVGRSVGGRADGRRPIFAAGEEPVAGEAGPEGRDGTAGRRGRDRELLRPDADDVPALGRPGEGRRGAVVPLRRSTVPRHRLPPGGRAGVRRRDRRQLLRLSRGARHRPLAVRVPTAGAAVARPRARHDRGPPVTVLERPKVGRLVVPYMVDERRSPIDFKAVDADRIERCAAQGRCGVWILVDAAGAASCSAWASEDRARSRVADDAAGRPPAGRPGRSAGSALPARWARPAGPSRTRGLSCARGGRRWRGGIRSP